MTGRVLLIDHPVSQRGDNASRLLQDWGWDLTWCCPGKGDALPAPAAFDAALVYGGAENLSETRERNYLYDEMDWIGGWVATGKPFLGICLGGQLLARALGADVAKLPDQRHEIGYFRIEPTEAGRASGFLENPMQVYQWHGEGFAIPEGAERLASGATFANQAFRYGEKAYGLQFHPEVSVETLSRWMAEVPHMLELPGAQPAQEQHAEAPLYQPVMLDWLKGFLRGWLPAV